MVCGVPQGTSLEPFLFIVAISDIPSTARIAPFASFVYDTKSWRIYRTTAKLYIYSHGWNKSTVGLKKRIRCLMMDDSKSCATNVNNWIWNSQYTLLHIKLQSEILHLWDTWDTLQNAYYQNVGKVQTTCWIELTRFRTRDKKTMIVLWKTYIQRHLSYCSQLWSRINVKLTVDIEAIHWSFTKNIGSLNQLSYCERLKQL